MEVYKLNILITGCNSGLGKSIVNKSEKYTFNIFPHFRKYNYDFPYALIGDIGEEGFSKKLLQYMKLNDIDVFINNAASYTDADIFEMNDDEIKNFINKNVVGQILCIKSALSFMKDKGNGLIININSIAGINPSAKEPLYCASKFAIKGFSKSMQIALNGQNINIVDIHLGAMKTNMTINRENYEILMEPDDVADHIFSFLMNDSTAIINEIIIRRS